jgi:tetratricopeptide (TPR) repeat protein
MALKAGRRDEAVAAFRQAVATDPCHIDSLLWLAGLCDDPQESMRHLSRVLALDPRNESAHEGIRWARRRLAGGAAGSRETLAVPLFVLPQAAAPRAQVAQTASLAPAQASRPPAAEPRIRRDTVPLGRRLPATPFALPLVALGFGLWLLLIGGMSGRIVWMLLQPTPSFNSAPLVVQAAPDEPPAAAAEPPPAAVEPASPSADKSSLYAAHADASLREVDAAWALADWERVTPLVAQAIAFRPDDPALRRKLLSAYFNRAVSLMDSGDLDNALRAYNQALEVMPGDPQAQVERDTLVNYMAGLNSFNQRNWPAAIQTLTGVYGSDAGYLDARELLYRANYNRGIELKQKKDLEGALKSFQSAVNLDSEAVEARGELAQVKAALAPPPPPPAPGASGAKWIDVNLTTQRFRALRGQTAVYSFVTSTGEPARPTNAGHYQVLDKIPNAYSRFWNLWMPYWMGIYWAGSSENGIHALPILSSGQLLWAGFLGRRVSFGCVILDTSAAKLMFDWTDIGTPVIIHY